MSDSSVSETNGLRVLVNELRTTVVGFYESVINAKTKTSETIAPIKENVANEWSFTMRQFHQIRRTHPWETVGLTSVTVGLLALPGKLRTIPLFVVH